MYEKKVPLRVLIIGNSSYQHALPILNAALDATSVAKFFEAADTKVVKTDLRRDAMLDEIDAFAATISPGDIAVVFYAGHGIQHGGNNYLVPLDSKNENELRIGVDNVAVTYVMDTLMRKDIGTGLVILDACRTNPFFTRSADGRTLERPEGLAESKAPAGVLIAYATSPGKIAWSGGDPKENSLYTRSLSNWVPTEGLAVETLFKRVRTDVLHFSKNEQKPWEESSLTGDLSLRPSKEELARHRTDWMYALELGNRDDILQYIIRNPASRYVDAARLWLREHPQKAAPASFAFSSVSGVLRPALTQSIDRLHNDEITVVARSRLPIYSKPDQAGQLMGFLEEGQLATMAAYPNMDSWARITHNKSNEAGFVSGVEYLGKPGNLVKSARLTSANTPADTTAVLQDVVRKFLDELKKGNAGIVLTPGLGEDESPSRARSLAFSQALALKVSLARRGVDPIRVAVQIPSAMFAATRRPDIGMDLIQSQESHLTVK